MTAADAIREMGKGRALMDAAGTVWHRNQDYTHPLASRLHEAGYWIMEAAVNELLDAPTVATYFRDHGVTESAARRRRADRIARDLEAGARLREFIEDAETRRAAEQEARRWHQMLDEAGTLDLRFVA